MDFHDQLDVFLNENKIGTLLTDNGMMSFAYDTEYLNTPGAYPLSKNLPLKEGFFTDPEVEGFFSTCSSNLVESRISSNNIVITPWLKL